MKEVKSKQSLGIKSKKFPAWLKQPVVRRLPAHTIFYVNISLIPRFPSTGM